MMKSQNVNFLDKSYWVFLSKYLKCLIIMLVSYLQKKKPKKDPLMMKKSKNDPHAPAFNRIPLPEM